MPSIAVASGKGGTGKTTVAAALALALGPDAQLLDCDVEEPNCHLFLRPEISRSRTVTCPVPVVDESLCNNCGRCDEVCKFSAIVVLPQTVMTFHNLCHGCGSCTLFCPEEAITEGARELGVVETGTANGFSFVQGRLRVGEAMSPPLIHAVKSEMDAAKVAIIDAPPGTSCPMIAAVNRADYALLVTEPTPFGLSDLTLAVAAVEELGIPTGVVINRSDIGDREVHEFCRSKDIEVLMEIPFSRRIAEVYARGGTLLDAEPAYTQKLKEIAYRIGEASD